MQFIRTCVATQVHRYDGNRSAISLSLKQKINTKSSTEAELVGVDDAMNFVVWTNLYIDLQKQHYSEESLTKVLGSKNIILQDNMSAIQLERYGKRSSTKQMRQIDIRYFYMTSKVYDQTVTAITYCLTKEMVTNYPTKSL